jgi:succinate dehydrogenase / fumarate reductase flavoprotein subunit
MAMKGDIARYDHRPIADDPLKSVGAKIARLWNPRGPEKIDALRRTMQSLMMEYGSVFRNEEGLKKGIEGIRSLKERYAEAGVADQGKIFNYALMEAIELGHQLNLAELVLTSALSRKESRGGHFRDDFPERDDRNYLKHTLVFPTFQGPEVRYKPVKITRFQPAARIY